MRIFIEIYFWSILVKDQCFVKEYHIACFCTKPRDTWYSYIFFPDTQNDTLPFRAVPHSLTRHWLTRARAHYSHPHDHDIQISRAITRKPAYNAGAHD